MSELSDRERELIDDTNVVIAKVLNFMKEWYPGLKLEEVNIQARYTIGDSSCINVHVDWEEDGTQSVSTRTYIKKNDRYKKELLDNTGENTCQ